MQTLGIAAVASATASFAASRLWGPGTLLSAAATPVIVALVSEVLRRPVQTVTVTAKKVPSARPRASRGSHPVSEAMAEHGARRRSAAIGQSSVADPRAPGRAGGRRANGHPDGSASGTPASAGAANGANGEAAGEITTYHVHRPRRRWRLALITGLVAFAIVMVVYTVSDALAGQSVTGNGQQTTFFGGSSSAAKSTTPGTSGTTSTPAPSQTGPAGASPTTSSTTAPAATPPSTTSTQTPQSSGTPAPSGSGSGSSAPSSGGASSGGSSAGGAAPSGSGGP